MEKGWIIKIQEENFSGCDDNNFIYIHMCVCMCLCVCLLSHPTLCHIMNCSPPETALSMGLSRQECCSGLPFPPPGDLPDPGIKPTSLISALGGFFTTEPPGNPHVCIHIYVYVTTD